MKKILLIMLLSLLGLTQAVAQESDGYLSIVREGAKWVNEKVIVNHGDTTRYYYNYQLSLKDTIYTLMGHEPYNPCYYFLADELNVERDSLIAALQDKEGLINCLSNNAYEKVESEGRALFHYPQYVGGGEWKLYDFRTEHRIINYFDALDYYMVVMSGAAEEVLTEENWIEVEPVIVEGVECWRYAYLGDDGEPLAYIVEGIGFDSRDMGDLLTPFTRQPDPDADYQEWCGLSHVVKDGQIIYKGMRYRHGAFTGIDETVADTTQRPADPNYYNLMGRPVGKDVPTAPGIYIHNGKKIVVR